ncbi:hypothetical protein SUGI_1037590 [Cryptomeria japonica]|nr:hypothetical protein SUGI_1037590 [Cryptomeria japonica]
MDNSFPYCVAGPMRHVVVLQCLYKQKLYFSSFPPIARLTLARLRKEITQYRGLPNSLMACHVWWVVKFQLRHFNVPANVFESVKGGYVEFEADRI